MSDAKAAETDEEWGDTGAAFDGASALVLPPEQFDEQFYRDFRWVALMDGWHSWAGCARGTTGCLACGCGCLHPRHSLATPAPIPCREVTSHQLTPHLILGIMGLEHCADTHVGNQWVRCGGRKTEGGSKRGGGQGGGTEGG